MFRDIPSIRFGVTDGRKADVFINDRPAGAIQFYQGTTWTYDHHGLSLVGTQLDIRKAIVRHNQPAGI